MSTPSRFLLCCENYPPSIGGVQEVMRQIAERLAKKGHEVTVATSTHPLRATDTVRNGVRVISFPISGNHVKGMYGPILEYQNLLQQGFDAILIKAAQQWTFDAATELLPLIQSRKLFIPCGFSGLNDAAYRRYFQRMPEWMRLFDTLIFYSNDYQDIQFARDHGLTELHCLPNGVDEREFADLDSHDIRQKLSIGDSHDILLSVGTLIAAKGHWEVIRAFRQAQLSRPTTLVINGNVPSNNLSTLMKRSLKHAISGRWPLTWETRWLNATQNEAAPPKRVIITDLNRTDLVNLYKASDLFVFASHIEYSPLVLFEAAASGTAFLASTAGNSQEIAKWTGGGQIYEAKRTQGKKHGNSILAERLEDIMSDSNKRIALGQTGRKSIFEKGFTWNKIAEQYHQLMQKTP